MKFLVFVLLKPCRYVTLLLQNQTNNPMKKLLLATLAMLAIACSSDDETKDLYECNNVYVGDVVLRSQAEVDAFAANDYCSVQGNMVIGSKNDDELSDIVSLVRLMSLKGVKGNLDIANNPQLESLEGLNNMVEVFQFNISNNAVLKNLQGLKSLVHLGAFTLEKLPLLTSLEGLENVKKIEVLSIAYNEKLISLQGFKNLTYSYLTQIHDNDALLTLKGAEQLKEVAYLQVYRNRSIADFEGIEGVSKIMEVVISENDGLLSLEGLHNLHSIELLTITDNKLLQSIKGLRGLTQFEFISSGNQLTINENESLESLEGLENVNRFKGYLEIYDNEKLKDFCAIKQMFVPDSNNFDVSATIFSNPYSPTWEDFQAGNCSQP